MRVKEIKNSISVFKEHLQSKSYSPPLYLYEILSSENVFAPPLSIEEIFTSEHTKRLWKRRNYSPLQHLKIIISDHPDYFEQSIRDLLDESKKLENRIDRFLFYMDELLQLYRNSKSDSNISDHQIDQAFISVILNKAYPKKYAFYSFPIFEQTALRIGAQPIPKVDDIGRYQNFIKIYLTLIQKDQELIDLFQRQMRKNHLSLNFIPANLALECMLVREQIDFLAD